MLCEYCKKEYISKRKSQKYCSLDCSYNAKKKGQSYICPICGKTFYRKKSEVVNGETLACSISCSVKLTKNRKNTAKLTTTKCETCGKTFTHRINEKRKFCSSGCEKKRKDKNTGRSQELLTKLFENKLEEGALVEKRFDGLKYKKKLPIDALFEKSKIAVELNGKHHYEESKYTSDTLQNQIIRDNLKIKFLLESGYNFIEWPYFTSLSKENVEKFIILANQQPSSPTYILAISEKVQRLDDEVVRPISHPRASDILELRDEDIVRTYGIVNHKK